MGWVQVKTYKGHELMITQDGKIVCYIDGTRKVFPDNGNFKIELIADNVKFDELDDVTRKIIDSFLR